MSSEVDAFAAWAAGFVDGEGCIRIARSNGRQRYTFVEVSISQASRPLLELFKERWGGQVSHKIDNTTSITKYEMFRYVVVAKKALALLADIYPYLRGKKEQAKIARTFGYILSTKRGVKNTEGWIRFSDYCFEKVKDLKRRPELKQHPTLITA